MSMVQYSRETQKEDYLFPFKKLFVNLLKKYSNCPKSNFLSDNFKLKSTRHFSCDTCTNVSKYFYLSQIKV